MFQDIITLIWDNLTKVSPAILWASLVLLAGVFVAKSAETLSAAFFNKVRLNQVLKRIGIKEALLRIEISLDAPRFFGEIVKWFFMIIFLMASSEILGLTHFSQFLGNVIAYLPNILVAFLIFAAAAFLSDISQKIVVGTLERERITYSKFLGKMIHWAIWFFAILAILYQLKITPTLILVVFIGMIATISIALGIAFGLGGKDLAAKILKELEEKFK